MLETSPSALRTVANGEVSSHVKSAALAESLLLVRASTMKMVRLQLAMERRDRALALKTMDEIVALDMRMGDFLNEMPIAASGLDSMREEIEEQRSALAREKFGLAAGVRRRDETVGPPSWAEPMPVARERAEEPEPTSADIVQIAPEPAEFADASPPRTALWVKILLAGLLILLAGAVTAAFLLQPDLLTDVF